MPACFALILAALVPWAGADGEALRGAYDAMECVEGGAIDDGGLVADEHTLAVFEGVYYYCSCISEADLENGIVVFAPP